MSSPSDLFLGKALPPSKRIHLLRAKQVQQRQVAHQARPWQLHEAHSYESKAGLIMGDWFSSLAEGAPSVVPPVLWDSCGGDPRPTKEVFSCDFWEAD